MARNSFLVGSYYWGGVCSDWFGLTFSELSVLFDGWLVSFSERLVSFSAWLVSLSEGLVFFLFGGEMFVRVIYLIFGVVGIDFTVFGDFVSQVRVIV